MRPFRFLGTLIVILCFSIQLQAQDSPLESVRTELRSVVEQEKEAFANGDCVTVLAMMDDNITFYPNGNPPLPKAVIAKFCEKIPRPFPEAVKDEISIHPLTSHAAYVVRTLEYPKDEKVKIREVVTKIWKKTGDTWKITHLHSTVNETSGSL